MKKHTHSRVTSMFIAAFNVKKWSDFDRMKGFTLYLENVVKNLFIPHQQVAEQTFDEALRQYNITEEALLKKHRGLLRFSVLMGVVAILLLCYSIYLAIFGSWHATLLSIVVMMLAVVLAFRYHFWAFQIKQRRLGCTVQEWFQRGLLGRKD